ncbi:helix-turn-helix domain-containing protein [Maribellus sediminis]|uniref:helix-turn-helix domain-containing protein n=1 Tax=Maribellus sediminis TaxID=2696285 RepID=UPI001431AF00|nr:AraC family transcriptional regulator [Maribellus sediminis]
MEITLLHAIELLAGFQAFLFAIYLVIKKDGQKSSNYFIALFIALLALNVLDYFAKFILNPFSENITVFIQTSIYLAAPALYFHIKTFLFPDSKFKAKDLMHLTVFVITNIVIIILIITEVQKGDIPEEIEYKVGLIFYSILYIQMYTYLFLSFRELRKHKQIFFENYSNTNTTRYAYLRNLIVGVGILFLLSFINILTKFVLQIQSLSFFSYVVISTVLFLFCWLIFSGLRSPELFIDEVNAQPPVKKLVKNSRFQNELDFEPEIKAQIEQVQKVMASDEPFLDPALTLHTLAKECHIPSRELSILINHHLNKHFFDFVNEYRIEKAMELLTSPDRKEYTVLEILYEVGFNSKSSFNTAFKKHTGFTPTEYRKQKSLSVA